MTPLTAVFTLINAVALIALPRKLALLPLLIGCCYMTVSQRIDVGPITLTVIRILVAIGFVRIIMRGERPAGGLNRVDHLMILWMVWFAFSSVLHPGGKMPLVFNLGQAFNIGGIYFLIRTFCTNHDELASVIRYMAWLLLPIAVEMIMEHATGKNLFSVFGANVMMRDDKFRATGPFSHAILAGSVGAACVPLMVSIWRESRLTSLVGILACLAIVVTSNSSGPLMSLIFGIGALCLWMRRQWLRYVLWGGVAVYAALAVLMERPAYYILDSIDLTGSSTGWHRARLIESSIDHLGEWWLAGTNFTRHWMPTGVSWSLDHCDITNYYILMGVWGGLPLTLLFIAMIWTAFRQAGELAGAPEEGGDNTNFMSWCAGAALFAHTATSISVAYFDQSYIFMFLCLAVISSLHQEAVQREKANQGFGRSGLGRSAPGRYSRNRRQRENRRPCDRKCRAGRGPARFVQAFVPWPQVGDCSADHGDSDCGETGDDDRQYPAPAHCMTGLRPRRCAQSLRNTLT